MTLSLKSAISKGKDFHTHTLQNSFSRNTRMKTKMRGIYCSVALGKRFCYCI